MTNKIKTRAEAKAASVRKWTDILDRIANIVNDVDTRCGFCDLAQHKSEGKAPLVFRCRVCEPDAIKLCEDYITDDQLITTPLSEAWDKIESLLNKIKALPDVLKKE